MGVRSTLVLIVPAALVMACGSSSQPPTAPGGSSTQPRAAATEPEQSANAKDPGRGKIAISREIQRACGIEETDTYFAYDSARISNQAQRVLDKLADCFASGPLAGRSMRLVGHADPRGGEEYNLVLGERRAESVARTLERFGLSEERMSTTSRGEMEAKGTDPASWAEDRRVDVILGS